MRLYFKDSASQQLIPIRGSYTQSSLVDRHSPLGATLSKVNSTSCLIKAVDCVNFSCTKITGIRLLTEIRILIDLPFEFTNLKSSLVPFPIRLPVIAHTSSIRSCFPIP